MRHLSFEGGTEFYKALPVEKRAYRGRRRTVSVEAIKTLKAELQSPTPIATRLGVSLMTVYRALESEGRSQPKLAC